MKDGPVLVTGGSGFIGKYVVAELQSFGRPVLTFDRHYYEGSHSTPINYYIGDIKDETDVASVMSHCVSWIHLAGVLGTQETIQHPKAAAETNLLGGLNVLEQAARLSIPGVNISVGNHFMNNTYSITKSTIERFCDMYRTERGLPVSVVRAFNAYGPGQSVSVPYGPSRVRKIIPSFIARALHGDPVEVYGDGQQIMDMIYVDDVASVLIAALEHTETVGPLTRAIDAGSGNRTTVLSVAETVCDSVGVDRSCISHLSMRAGEPERSVVIGDTSTLADIDFDPAEFTSLRDGIDRTVKYYKDYFQL